MLCTLQPPRLGPLTFSAMATSLGQKRHDWFCALSMIRKMGQHSSCPLHVLGQDSTENSILTFHQRN